MFSPLANDRLVFLWEEFTRHGKMPKESIISNTGGSLPSRRTISFVSNIYRSSIDKEKNIIYLHFVYALATATVGKGDH